VQLDLQCNNDNWALLGTFSFPEGANLTTPLATNCALCVEGGGAFPDRVDNVTHCVGKCWLSDPLGIRNVIVIKILKVVVIIS